MRTTILLALLVSILTAQAEPQPVTSEIKSVKVFLSGAQITRHASASITAGVATLRFAGISRDAEPSSIQVSGQGAFTILSVKHELNHLSNQAPKEEVKALEDRIKVLQRNMAEARVRMELLQREEQFLLQNYQITGTERGSDLTLLMGVNDYFRERMGHIKIEALNTSEQIDSIHSSLKKLHDQLGQIKGRAPSIESDVMVEVSALAALEATFEISYIVRTAGWSPAYDIRVESIDKPLDLTYRAHVYQSTGEDWENVALVLSSGDPSQGMVMPELQPWYINFGRPTASARTVPVQTFNPAVREVRGIIRDATSGEPLPQVQVTIQDQNGNTLNGTTSGPNGYYALAVPFGGRNIGYTLAQYASRREQISSTSMNMVLDNTSAYSREAMEKMPRSNLVGSLSYAAGTYQSHEGLISVAGSRGQSTMYVVDGMQMKGVVDLPMDAIDEVQIINSGLDASQGRMPDATFTFPAHQRAVPNRARQVVETVHNYRATTFEFAIDVPYTIPSNGQQYTVGVGRHNVDALYRHYATPKLDRDAFLFAKATGWEALNLLPGPANLYFEGTFVGESYLDVSTVVDTLDLSLGRDKGVSITRTKRTDFTKRQFIGNKRTVSISWELAVRNNKGQAIDLVITDQYPLSKRSEIEVSLDEHSGADVNKEKGFLSWNKKLAPSASDMWHFTYSVKYPKGQVLYLE